MTARTALIAVALMTLITQALRFLPFLLFSGRKTPRFLEKLGRMLPYAMMGILVVYCLRTVHFTELSGFLPELIAGAVVAGSYLWKRSTLLSIIGGTACYMLLVQFVFV